MRVSISVKITAAIIVSLTLEMGIHFWLESSSIKKDLVENMELDTRVLAINLQQTLSFLAKKKEHRQIQATITALASNPKVNGAYFINENRKIIAATTLSDIQQNIKTVLAENITKQLDEKLPITLRNLKTHQWLSNDNMTLLSASPIRLGTAIESSLRPEKAGFLIILMDLTWIDDEASYRLQNSLAPIIAAFIITTAIILLFFHKTIGARIKQLHLSAQEFKLGEEIKPSKISGHDEISELSDTFNSLITHTNKQHIDILTKQHHLKLSQEIANLGSWELDLNTGKLLWSSQVYKIFGVDRDAFESSFDNFISLIHPDERQLVKDAYTSSIENHNNDYEIEHRIYKQSTGELRYVHEKCIHIKDQDGKIIKSIGMVHDITEKKQAEKLLFQQKKEQQQILESMVDGVISIDQNATILTFNRSAEKLFQLSAKEAIGQNIKIIMPNEVAQHHDDFVKQYLITGKAGIIGIGREVIGQRQNGEKFPLRLSIAELPKDEDGTRRFIGTCHDVSIEKSQEQQLRQSMKMEALGKLTGGIAHDFNNMLGVIMGFAELLKLKVNDDPKLTSYIDEIHQAGMRAKKLTSKLLSISRKKINMEEEITDLRQLILEEKHLLEKTLTARIKLTLDLEEELWPVYIEKFGFEDVVLNISINAMHAMPEGGSFTISGTNARLQEVGAKSLNMHPGDYVLLTFTDTGNGMTEEQKEKIFDPFFTTKEDGTGLGMSQVYGFVQRAKGTINVYSELDIGTSIFIYIPRFKGSHKSTTINNQVIAHNYGGNERVLIVDDEAALRDLVKEILSLNHYEVETAESGKKALEILENKKFDLVLSDIIMPEMNGYQLAEKIQNLYPEVKIQLASGFVEKEIIPEEYKEIHDNRLIKPFNTDTLLKRIREVLDNKY